MFAFVIMTAAILGLGAGLFAWLEYYQRLQNAREGVQNARGSKLLVDDVPPADPAGQPVQDHCFLSLGGETGSNCISQWRLAFLCEGERLRLRWDTSSSKLSIQTAKGRLLGWYPPDDRYYQELVQRLTAGQTVSAWVDEWGARRRFFCDIKLELYGDAAVGDTVPAQPESSGTGTLAVTSSVVFFPTHSLAATEAFYHGTLGFAAHHQTAQSIIFDTGYGYLGFVNYGDDHPLSENCCISLNCPSRSAVDQAYGRLRRNHIILQAPQRHPVFPVYSFFMNDPNGYTLEWQVIENTF